MVALLSLYSATGTDRERINLLWEEAGQPTPQIRLPAGAPKPFRELVRAEREAAQVRIIAPSILPGLLQTADYARAVHMAYQTRDPGAHVEDVVSARLDRQKLLDGRTPLRLHSILDEAVLRRQVGGTAVMATQLDHVVAMSAKPNITIQVIPDSAGAYGSMSGPCSILSYDDPDDASSCYLEHPAGGVWVDDEGDVQHLLAMFDGVSTTALPPYDTAELIREQARKLREL